MGFGAARGGAARRTGNLAPKRKQTTNTHDILPLHVLGSSEKPLYGDREGGKLLLLLTFLLRFTDSGIFYFHSSF